MKKLKQSILIDEKGKADNLNNPIEQPKGESTKPYHLFQEIGQHGLRRYGNFIFEEFMPQLRAPQAYKVYQEMSDNDATIGAIFYMTEQLVRKAHWTVIPASESEEDRNNAKFIEECMHDMSTSWSDFICEALSMMIYGWSFHEIIYKIRKGPLEKDGKYRSQYTDGKFGWRSMPSRSQHTLYGWDFNQDGDAVAMIQMAPPHFKQVRIPFRKGMLFRTKTTHNNPEGKSLLRNAYRPWFFKKRIEEIEGIGIERDLAGLPVLQPPENIQIWDTENPQSVALLAQAEQLVKNVRRDQSEGLVIPFGWEFDLVSTGGTRQFDTSDIINRYDQRIAITMLADLVMLGADKVGSYALADAKTSFLAACIEAQIQAMADVINKNAVIPLMHLNNMNFDNGYPKLHPDNIEDTKIEDISSILQVTGLNIYSDLELFNRIRSLLGLSNVNEEEFELQKEAKEKELKDMATKFGQNNQQNGNENNGKVGESKNGSDKTNMDRTKNKLDKK